MDMIGNGWMPAVHAERGLAWLRHDADMTESEAIALRTLPWPRLPLDTMGA